MSLSSHCRLAAFLFVSFLSVCIEARGIPWTELLSSRQTKVGFSLAPKGMFAGLGLAATCEQVLYQDINCDPFVVNLAEKVYHGSPGDQTTTDSICSKSCSMALATARRRIAGACASTPNLFEGYAVLSLIDAVTSGWQETCLKDADGAYCNVKIEAFEPVDDLADMPHEELCSFCYGEKLRLMQKSPYSAYDTLHAERLSYINENCGGNETPTAPQPPAITPSGTDIETCITGNVYTVQAGDTCNSIAQAKSVSAATLYYINPNLVDCDELTPGTVVCLPLSCVATYTVEMGEDCVTIGVEQATSWQSIINWNSGIDSRCSNIWSSPATTPYWGNVICVSAPGGLPDDNANPGNGTGVGNGNSGGPGGSGNGYADEIVDPPSTGTVAQGTTTACGQYMQAEDGLTCSTMIYRHSVPIGRFVRANPSLRNVERCSEYLRPGIWYCLLPTRGFDGFGETASQF